MIRLSPPQLTGGMIINGPPVPVGTVDARGGVDSVALGQDSDTSRGRACVVCLSI